MRRCCVCDAGPLSEGTNGGYYSIENNYYCVQHGREKNEQRKPELIRQMLGELFFDDSNALKVK